MRDWQRDLMIAVALSGLAAAGCKRPAARPSEAKSAAAWSDPSPHQSRFLRVNGVRLNVLDWGGTGLGLVFLHGLGDSPHAYDDLAPAFVSGHRVIAYARRGHGQSEHPAAGPYDNETLVEDLRQILDSLGIARAVLGGWSMGGNEITRFAERYPDRVAAIIYLDAGYDWSDTTVGRLFGALPGGFEAGPADRVSFTAFHRWWINTTWPGATLSPAAEAEIRDVSVVDSTGAVTVPTDAVMDPLFKSLTGYHRDYAKVKAPVLALFVDQFLPPNAPDSIRTKVAEWNREWTAFQGASIARLTRELSGRFEHPVLPGSQHPAFPWIVRDTLITLIKGFLESAARSQ